MTQNHAQYRRNQQSLILSTYPPQQCGIATFARDLRNAIASHMGERSTAVAAVGDVPTVGEYPAEVILQFSKQHRPSYRAVAEYINASQYDTVSIQHEFGIFGGDEGSYLLDLLGALRKPSVTTLHTVLANPEPHYLQRMQQVVEASDAVVVITPTATRLLSERYGVDERKVHTIPHGIPDLPYVDTEPYKKRFGLEGRMVIMTFGLIGPSKGIEDMIQAMPAVVSRHPEAVYIVVGATHPGVIASQGEKYRESLHKMVADLGLTNNVIFENRYLSNNELHNYLNLCDIYVTPYANPEQISSGTLAYAAGSGKAVIATPYRYAQDLLACGRGMLVDFHSQKGFSDAINLLIESPAFREAMRRRAYEFGRSMTWSNVGKEYLSLFERLASKRFSRLPGHNRSVAEPARQNAAITAQQLAPLKQIQAAYGSMPATK